MLTTAAVGIDKMDDAINAVTVKLHFQSKLKHLVGEDAENEHDKEFVTINRTLINIFRYLLRVKILVLNLEREHSSIINECKKMSGGPFNLSTNGLTSLKLERSVQINHQLSILKPFIQKAHAHLLHVPLDLSGSFSTCNESFKSYISKMNLLLSRLKTIETIDKWDINILDRDCDWNYFRSL
jgi:hypothetical protein